MEIGWLGTQRKCVGLKPNAKENRPDGALKCPNQLPFFDAWLPAWKDRDDILKSQSIEVPAFPLGFDLGDSVCVCSFEGFVFF